MSEEVAVVPCATHQHLIKSIARIPTSLDGGSKPRICLSIFLVQHAYRRKKTTQIQSNCCFSISRITEPQNHLRWKRSLKWSSPKVNLILFALQWCYCNYMSASPPVLLDLLPTRDLKMFSNPVLAKNESHKWPCSDLGSMCYQCPWRWHPVWTNEHLLGCMHN